VKFNPVLYLCYCDPINLSNLTWPINSYPISDGSSAVRHHAIYAFQVASQIIYRCNAMNVEIHYSEYYYTNFSQNMDMSLWCIAIIMHLLKMPLTCYILI